MTNESLVDQLAAIEANGDILAPQLLPLLRRIIEEIEALKRNSLQSAGTDISDGEVVDGRLRERKG